MTHDSLAVPVAQPSTTPSRVWRLTVTSPTPCSWLSMQPTPDKRLNSASSTSPTTHEDGPIVPPRVSSVHLAYMNWPPPDLTRTIPTRLQTARPGYSATKVDSLTTFAAATGRCGSISPSWVY